MARRTEAQMRQYADDMLDALNQTLGRWSPGSEVQNSTGMPRYRVVGETAAYIRENDLTQTPLLSSSNGYQLSGDLALARRFYRWRLNTAVTVVRRLVRGLLIPLSRLFPADQAVQDARLNLERGVVDLERVVAALDR